MEISVTAEYEPNPNGFEDAPDGYVNLSLNGVCVLSVPATSAPHAAPGAEEEVILGSILAWFSEVENLVEEHRSKLWGQ